MHAMAWAIAPTRNERLASLLERYGCPDVVAPVDAMAYGRRAGQVIGRALARPKARPGNREAGPAHGICGDAARLPPCSTWTRAPVRPAYAIRSSVGIRAPGRLNSAVLGQPRHLR